MTQLDNLQQVRQRTLTHSISYVGIGLHTGKKVSMVIRPTQFTNGIYFLRKDLQEGKNMIAARWYNVVDTSLCTVLGNAYGATVGTVEHLLAALHGCGIDNAIVEIDGPEVPIMDGSSDQFVSMIEKIGATDQPELRKAIWIHRPIEVGLGDRYAILLPSQTQRVTVEIDFPETSVGFQSLSVELINEAFRKQVARARTFGFANQIEQLRKQGFARGGSLKNAILVDGDRIVNEEGLRYQDEFVRHKILDCVGDLALAGVPIIGHYFAHKPGHQVNIELISRLFNQQESWSYITVDELNRIFGAADNTPAARDPILEKMHYGASQN